MVTFCPHCRRTQRVADDWNGQRVRCLGCQHEFRISPADALEDVVSGWITEDVQAVEHMRARHQKVLEQI